jgi:CheY-like chemotaxis protein
MNASSGDPESPPSVKASDFADKFVGKRALVVEDNEAMRELYQVCLEAMGFDVVAAKDGLVALAIVMNERFDLTLCDVQMPRLSGVSFTRRTNERNEGALGRLIFVSAVDDYEVARELKQIGAVAFLVKPVSLVDLRQTIDRAMTEA